MKLKACLMIFSAVCLISAVHAQPVGNATMFQPITPVADATHVLVTAPYCPSGGTPYGVYDITSGFAVPFTNFTGLVPNQCQEIAIAISPGLAGFLPGWVYVAYPNTSGTVSVARIPPTGGAPQFFVTLPTPIANPTSANLGITFDAVGTFGNSLIVTTGSGVLFLINSAGTFTQHQITGGGFVGVELESPRVAPLSFGQYGGYLFATGEAPPSVFAIQPGTLAVTSLPAGPALSPRPESLAFGTGVGACSVAVGPNHVQATLFDSVYQANRVDFFNVITASKGFINSEFSPNTLNYLNPDGTLGAQIWSYPGISQEHLATVTPRTDTPSCTPTPPPPTRACTLTQGGYKNNFNNLVLNFPPGGLTLGNHFYTNTQLNAILQNNAIKGNGLLSLAHQLITAELNLAYGAVPTNQTQLTTLLTAIQQANLLIGNLLIPPVGNDSLPTSTTSTVESILDLYNNGGLGVSHCQ